jgi:hypothetical protein
MLSDAVASTSKLTATFALFCGAVIARVGAIVSAVPARSLSSCTEF